jgi:hypothetical protein
MFSFGMNFLRAGTLLATVLLTASGCGSLHGPSLDVTAPRIVGRAVDAQTGQPVAHARVGRRLSGWRGATGGFPRGAEELLLLQDEVRTGKDGRFTLAGRRVALLFSLRDPGLDLDLSIRHGAYQAWHTNYPISALANDPTEARIDAGDLRLDPR